MNIYPDVRLYHQFYDEIIIHAKRRSSIRNKNITESCMEVSFKYNFKW